MAAVALGVLGLGLVCAAIGPLALINRLLRVPGELVDVVQGM